MSWRVRERGGREGGGEEEEEEEGDEEEGDKAEVEALPETGHHLHKVKSTRMSVTTKHIYNKNNYSSHEMLDRD